MIKIEVWSDINCPFCYIGKRHLEAALKDFSQTEVSVEWKSFELDPAANPPKGVSQEELLAKKYGKDVSWARHMNNNLTDMARKAGLDFHMDQVVPANSFQAHRLIHLAKVHDLQDKMKERLLKARFVEGQDIGNIDTLRKLGADVGLKQDEMNVLFETENFTEEVRQDEKLAHEIGVQGVPFFVFNQKYAVSGAQPVEVFKEVLEKSI